MKLLKGSELSGYIKERQSQQVRALRQAYNIFPKLAIIRTNSEPVVDSYMKFKKEYGKDILVDVDIYNIDQSEAISLIDKLNNDSSVHGIIVQLPLPDKSQTDEILNSVSTEKDVDGLSKDTKMDAATPIAINWLLSGYNVELRGKKIVIVGQGRLVGKPLARMWKESELNVETADRATKNLRELVYSADIIVTATGKPGLITSDMIKINAVVVDAGVATDANGLIGDVATDVYERHDLTITPPRKGGVGPLTVCALFENVIKAARASKELS